MFDLKIDRDPLGFNNVDYVQFTIIFNYNGMEITLIPEAPEIFVDSKLIDDIHANVSFDSFPGNGTFSIDLNDYLTMCVGKYGDGLGGTLSVKVERTYKISRELSAIVKKISDYINNEPELFNI